jgi:5-methylcytosine-specific restriction endonuclease McrA
MISPITKRCKTCGKKFTTTSNAKVYCSYGCSKTYIKIYQRQRLKTKEYKIKCKFCSNIFITDQPNRKYCNNECSKRYREEKYYKEKNGENTDKNKIVYDNCRVCNKEFIKTARYHICCSDDCKEANRISNLYVGKFIIFNRDNFTCIYCGKSSIEDGIKLHLDHIIPISKGGKNTADNLVTSCSMCNLEKHNLIIETKNIIKVVMDRNNKNNINNKSKINNNDYKNRIDRLCNKDYLNC